MAENQKDLTSIIDLSKEFQKTHASEPMPEGFITQETPIEQISDFESLESYTLANPVAETPPPTDPVASPAPAAASPEPSDAQFPISEPAADPLAGLSSDPAFPPSDPNFPETTEASSNPSSDFQTSDFPQDPGANPATSDFQTDFSQPPPDASASGAEPPPEPSDFATPVPDPEPEPLAVQLAQPSPPENTSSLGEFIAPVPTQTKTPLPAEPEAVPEPILAPPPSPKKQTLQASLSPVPAAFPFSVLIEGPLTPEEKEKLIDLIVSEQMGIREMDLEPQLQGNKILIPRISEFAAVMVVQAMRTTTARMRFGPSDQIFSSTDAQSEVTLSNTSVPTPEQIHIPKTLNEEPTHPAEIIPLTMERHLPLLDKYTLIDTITASAALESYAVEVDKSQEYQNLIDALQKEIRFKAFRRGAAGVISFRLQITPLTSPSRYRITAMGLAIKSR